MQALLRRIQNPVSTSECALSADVIMRVDGPEMGLIRLKGVSCDANEVKRRNLDNLVKLFDQQLLLQKPRIRSANGPEG